MLKECKSNRSYVSNFCLLLAEALEFSSKFRLWMEAEHKSDSAPIFELLWLEKQDLKLELFLCGFCLD